MRRTFACLALFWFFYRFDMYEARLIVDGGHVEQRPCEVQAASHGYLTVLVSSRPEYDAHGRLLGYWRVACFEGPETIRSALTVNVPVHIR